MVLDTSAIVAILLSEPERDIFTRLVETSRPIAVSVVTFHEAAVVMAGKKRGSHGAALVDDLIGDTAAEIVSLDVEGSLLARAAYFRFGRGFHPAGLNFADCFSYALAKARGEPLLFKGDDFFKTDIVPAWRP
jgi:ribonuclease VapC